MHKIFTKTLIRRLIIITSVFLFIGFIYYVNMPKDFIINVASTACEKPSMIITLNGNVARQNVFDDASQYTVELQDKDKNTTRTVIPQLVQIVYNSKGTDMINLLIRDNTLSCSLSWIKVHHTNTETDIYYRIIQ